MPQCCLHKLPSNYSTCHILIFVKLFEGPPPCLPYSIPLSHLFWIVGGGCSCTMQIKQYHRVLCFSNVAWNNRASYCDGTHGRICERPRESSPLKNLISNSILYPILGKYTLILPYMGLSLAIQINLQKTGSCGGCTHRY